MSRQHVVAALALALLCVVVAEATSHGGNYGRRTFRYLSPSWTYGGYYGSHERGGGGPERQFGDIGKRASDSGADRLPTDLSYDVRSASGGDWDHFRDSGFPRGYYGGGGVPGRFPGSGGSEVRFPDNGGSEVRFPDNEGSGGRFSGSGGSGRRFPGSGGSEVRFPDIGGSEVRFPDNEGSGGRFPGSGGSGRRFPGSGGSEVRFPDSGGSGGRFPDSSLPGGDFAGAGQSGDNIELTDLFNDLGRNNAGAPSGGRCPPTRPSCTTSRTRAQYCESDTCGPGRKCCFDACLQKDVCKTTI